MISSIIHDPAVSAIALLALVAGLSDWVLALVVAIKNKVFDAAYVAEYLAGHVLTRFVPIVLLAVLGAVTTAVVARYADAPAALVALAPTVTLAAWGGLAAYVIETVASLKASTEGDVL